MAIFSVYFIWLIVSSGFDLNRVKEKIFYFFLKIIEIRKKIPKSFQSTFFIRIKIRKLLIINGEKFVIENNILG
jgi:hypothetical protein